MLCLNSPWGGWQCQVPREGRHLTGTEGLQLTSFHGLVKSSRLLRARAPALCGHRGNSLVGRVTLQCLPKTQTPHSTDHFVCPQKSHCTDRKVSYRKGKILSISSWQFSERKRRLHGEKNHVSMVCYQKIAINLSISAHLCGCDSRNKGLSTSVS